MKIQFFYRGARTGNLMSGCGERSVLNVSNDQSLSSCNDIAIDFNAKNNARYAAYQIFDCAECPLTAIIFL